MTIFFDVLAMLALAAGVVGAVVPAIPGPPLAYLSLLLVSVAYRKPAYSTAFLIVMAVIAGAVFIVDRLLERHSSGKRNTSRAGVLGSVFGMLFGMTAFPPFGLLLGAFAGAVVGEFVFTDKQKRTGEKGWGVFISSVLGTVLELCYAGIAGYFALRAILS